MDYMKELEQYQEKNDLSTADMARLFGVGWQRYKNWINRNSLPKSYYDKANELLDSVKPRSAKDKADKLLDGLSPAGLEAAIKSLEAIAALEKKS